MDPEKKRIQVALVIASIITSIPWLIFAIETGLNESFSFLGVYPRSFKGLIGIVTQWLVHGDLEHLMSNSFSLWVCSAILFYNHRKYAFEIFFYLILTTGAWVFVGARGDVYHIGASGLVYALVAFGMMAGFLTRDKRLLGSSFLIIFLHSGLLYGMLPIDAKISFESHIIGFLAGIFIAYRYKKHLIPKVIIPPKIITIPFAKNYWESATITTTEFRSITFENKDDSSLTENKY